MLHPFPQLMPPKIEDPFPSDWTLKPTLPIIHALLFSLWPNPKNPSSSLLPLRCWVWPGYGGYAVVGFVISYLWVLISWLLMDFSGFWFQYFFYFDGWINQGGWKVGVDWLIWWWGSDLQVVGGSYGGFGWLYILCFGCGGLQFVVIMVVGGVTVVERGQGIVAMAEALLVVVERG